MKLYILSISIFLLIFSSSVVISETINDLVIRNNIYYKKFSDVPFTGKVTGQKQGSFRNGKKHGKWLDFWENLSRWEIKDERSNFI